MSKRGSKSIRIINSGRSITLGSIKRIVPKRKKTNKIALTPNDDDMRILTQLEINFISDFTSFSLGELILLAREKVNEVVKLSTNTLIPNKLKFEKKTKEDVIRIITISQNKILELIRTKS